MLSQAFTIDNTSVYLFGKDKRLSEYRFCFDFRIDDLFFVFLDNGLWAVESREGKCLIFNSLEIIKIDKKINLY